MDSRGDSPIRAPGVVDDGYIRKIRRELSDLDGEIVMLVNRRLRLVAKLKRYKDTQGIAFLDLAREGWMLQYLHRLNHGPLSREGLEELYQEVLALTKREVLASERRASEVAGVGADAPGA
jgi:chorismate mutase / prephenate dehydratase